jgi:hypothetical protein
MAEKKEEETELEKLTKLRDDYEKIECNGISVKWDKEKGEFIIKLYDDENEKTYYLIFDRKELTIEQRIGLREIARITETVLWERGNRETEQMLYA